MNFSTAEELDQEKIKIRKQRKQKLTQDRRNPHGNQHLAQTDGLKTIRTNNQRNKNIVIDNQVFDLRRVRNSGDLLTEDELYEMESWYT